jgi:hypothetical protein
METSMLEFQRLLTQKKATLGLTVQKLVSIFTMTDSGLK